MPKYDALMISWEGIFNYFVYQGIARTQSPTTKNNALESSTFGMIAKVSQIVVQ